MATFRLIPLIVEATQFENGDWIVHNKDFKAHMTDEQFKQTFEPVYHAEEIHKLNLIYRPPIDEELAKNPRLKEKFDLAKKLCEETQKIDMTSDEVVEDKENYEEVYPCNMCGGDWCVCEGDLCE